MHSQPLTSASQLNFSSLATETKLVTSGFESHLAYTDLLEENKNDVVQVSIYHHLPINPDQEQKSKWAQAKRQRALQKFKVAEEKLLKNDPAACKMFQAIQAPLLELERYRASALVDVKACRSLISQIGDIQDPATAIVIGNPGAGILSKELIRQGAKQLVLFEANPEIRAHLKKIHKNDPVVVCGQYLFGSVWKCTDNKPYLISLLESTGCNRVKIIQSVTNPCQPRELLANYTTGQIPFENKDVEIYLITQKDYGEKLASLEKSDPANKKIRFSSAWRTFVTTEIACTLPADSFFPTFAPLGFGVKGHNKRDPHVAVLRCTFRPIMFSGRHLNIDERHLYDLFIRHVMTSPKAQVAHSLEKWTPGIGIRLIRQGISLFTRFSELSKEEFERVFFTFVEFAPVDSSIWVMMGGNYKTNDPMSQ